MKLLVILCALVFISVDCQLAPFIEPCHANDKACLMRSAQNALPTIAQGVPSLGMQRLDPLRVDYVDASTAGLTLHFRRTTVKGLRNCRVIDIGRPTHHETFVTLSCQVELTGDYKLGGHLMLMPIEGQGKYRIKLREIVVKVVMEVDVAQTMGGGNFWVVKSWTHHADATQRVHFQFQNLFNGNQAMAKSVQQVANQNWHRIFEEVAPPIVKAIISQVVTEIKKLFYQVPISQLALD